MTPPGPPGRSVFSLEGRSAPGLYVAGWVGSVLGGALALVGALGSGGAGGSILFVAGMAVLDLGLISAAGSQAIDRRARGTEAYQGPSPLLVLLAAMATVYLLAVLVGLPLAAAGVSLPRPAGDLLLVAISAATYGGITRLLVVGTGALTWGSIGFSGSLRQVIGDLAWGMALAGPVILVTSLLAALLVAGLKVAPASPLPPTGTLGGLLLNLAAGALLAPVGEEILFRGVATTAWVRSLGARAGVVRAAVLFAAVHVLMVGAATFGEAVALVLVGFLGRLPVALVLGWAFLHRGTIWAPIGLHAAFNGFLIVLAELGSRTPS